MKNYTVYYQVREGNKIVSYGEIFLVNVRDHNGALIKFQELKIEGSFVVQVKQGYHDGK